MNKIMNAFIVTACFALGATVGASAESILKNHDTYQPLDISAERLEMKQKQGRAVFKGAVKVTQGNLELNADSLTVFYSTDAGIKDPTIKSLNVEGSVTLVSQTESLSGDWGVYDVDRRLVTIGGNVTFSQGDNVVKGNRLEFDLVSGLAKLDGQNSKGNDGRVKGTFNLPSNKS